MHPWQQVIEELVSSSSIMNALHFTAKDAIGAIEEFVSRNVNPENQLPSGTLPGRNFCGTIHSQAALASVLHRSKLGECGDFVCVLDWILSCEDLMPNNP
jgi:hypothetical protein